MHLGRCSLPVLHLAKVSVFCTPTPTITVSPLAEKDRVITVRIRDTRVSGDKFVARLPVITQKAENTSKMLCARAYALVHSAHDSLRA